MDKRLDKDTRVCFLATCVADGIPEEEIGKAGRIVGYDGSFYLVCMDAPWVETADISEPWAIHPSNFEVIS